MTPSTNILMSQVELERIARAAMKRLYDGLNTEITAQASAWSTEDAAFAAATGRTPTTITLEPVSSENFYVGHRPSLIDAPIEKYPNCAVMAFTADPVQSTDDWQEQFTIRLAVEVMVKATEDEGEEMVNSRILRTANAVQKVFKSSAGRNLGGIIPKMSTTPTITIGDVFAGKQERGHGPRFVWQGARLEYRIQQWVTY